MDDVIFVSWVGLLGLFGQSARYNLLCSIFLPLFLHFLLSTETVGGFSLQEVEDKSREREFKAVQVNFVVADRCPFCKCILLVCYLGKLLSS